MATASDTGNPPRPLAPGLGWVTEFLSFLYPTRAECPSRRPCCSSRVL